MAAKPCTADGCAEHERLWELRESNGSYLLFCPLCENRLGSDGNGAGRPADARLPAAPTGCRPGAAQAGARKARPAATRCRSCGRELPRLSIPMAEQSLCAFCRNVLHKG